MRVRNGLPETAGEVFFSTAAAPGFAACGRQRHCCAADMTGKPLDTQARAKPEKTAAKNFMQDSGG